MSMRLVTQEQIEALTTVVERLEAKGIDEESRTLREVLAQLQSPPQDVPASTAAEILGVPPQVVCNWVRAGILPGRQDLTGHFHVPLDVLEPTIRMNQVKPRVSDELAAITDDEINAAIQAVREERAARRRAADNH